MEEIQVQVLQNEVVLSEWKTSCCGNLQEMITALQQNKKSVNDFLTDLKNSSNLDHSQPTEHLEIDEDDEDDLEEDPLSDALKQITSVEEKVTTKKKRTNSGNNRKRIKMES